MQRATFPLVSLEVRCIVFVVIGMVCAVSEAQVVDYLCQGELRTDKVFEADGVSSEARRFKITANISAGYVKRDPALAAGCFAGRTEVCACEPPSTEKIMCRSLGFRADGTEVSLDFTLNHSNQTLSVAGKEFNARSGTLIEIQGLLACSRFSVSPSP